MALNISKEKAKRLFPVSEDWFKQELIAEFGEGFFKQEDWEKIKSYEDALAARPLDDEDKIFETDTPDVIAYKKIKHCVKAINGTWKADYLNSNQAKWFPWFKVLPSGLGFAGSYSYYDLTSSRVGSRLCYESDEKATHAGIYLIDLYSKFFF